MTVAALDSFEQVKQWANRAYASGDSAGASRRAESRAPDAPGNLIAWVLGAMGAPPRRNPSECCTRRAEDASACARDNRGHVLATPRNRYSLALGVPLGRADPARRARSRRRLRPWPARALPELA